MAKQHKLNVVLTIIVPVDVLLKIHIHHIYMSTLLSKNYLQEIKEKGNYPLVN